MSHGEEEEPKVHSSKVWRNLKKCGLWPRGSEQPPVLPRPATQCPPSNFRWTLIFPMKSLRDISETKQFGHHIIHHISSHPHPAWQEQLRLQICPLPSLPTMIRTQFTVLWTLRRNYEEALCPTSWPRSIHADLPKISTILVPSSLSSACCRFHLYHWKPFRATKMHWNALNPPFRTKSCPRGVPQHHAGKVAVDRAALSLLQVT